MKNKKKILGLLFVILWLGVIFYFSASDSSSSTSQTNIAINTLRSLAEQNPFFNFILLKLTEKHSLVYSIRKLAHLTIFCILQLIIFWVMKLNGYSTLKASVFSIVGVIIYASFDEMHQYFTPGRSAQVKDVFIDSIGGSIGLIISYFIIILKSIILKISQKIRHRLT